MPLCFLFWYHESKLQGEKLQGRLPQCRPVIPSQETLKHFKLSSLM